MSSQHKWEPFYTLSATPLFDMGQQIARPAGIGVVWVDPVAAYPNPTLAPAMHRSASAQGWRLDWNQLPRATFGRLTY